MDVILEIITAISLLFMVAIYVQFWMMRKQINRVDGILCQFHDMFFNAYQVISEAELNHIVNSNTPTKDNREVIKEWDEGN